MWCSGRGLLVFVQERSFLCAHAGQLLSVSVRLGDWVYNGVLVCPACELFCERCPVPHQRPATNASRSSPIGQCGARRCERVRGNPSDATASLFQIPAPGPRGRSSACGCCWSACSPCWWGCCSAAEPPSRSSSPVLLLPAEMCVLDLSGDTWTL